MASERSRLLESTSEPSLGDNQKIDRHRGRVVTVEPILVLFLFSATTSSLLIRKLLVNYIHERHNSTDPTGNVTGQSLEVNNTADSNEEVNDAVTLLNAVTLLADTVPAAVLLIYLGPLSDHAGRKKLLFPPLIGALLATCLTAFIVYLALPRVFLLSCLLLSSFCGGETCLLVGCYAYIADRTSHAQRLFRFIILEVCILFSLALTYTSLDYLLSVSGYIYLLVADIVVIVVLLFYTRCLLPESVQRISSPPCSCATSCYAFWLFVKDDGSRRKPKLQLSLLIGFILMLVTMGTASVMRTYLIHPPVSWDSTYIRYYTGAMFLTPSLAGLLLAGTLAGKLAETTFVLAGCVSALIYFIFLASSTSALVIFIGTAASVGVLLPMGALRAFTSKLVASDEHGALFTGIRLMTSLAGLLGAVLFNTLYGLSTSYVISLTWMVAAGVMILPLLLTGILRWYIWLERKNLIESLYISHDSSSSGEIRNSTRYNTSNPASTEASINDLSSDSR